MASSLPVGFESLLSVQELAKEPMVAVPQRYVRLDQEPSLLSDGTSLPTIPTIDMKNLVTSQTADIELEKLHSTCKEWGFFQLVNHGVSTSLVDKLKFEIEEFFKLPLEEKMKYKRRSGEVEGYGPTLQVSEDQKLDWGDRFYMMINPLSIRKPHLFQELPPSLRAFMESQLLAFKEGNPQLEVVTELIRGQHPHLKGFYRFSNPPRRVFPEEVELDLGNYEQFLAIKLTGKFIRDTLESYVLELQNLAMTLLRLMGKALKMDVEVIEKLFEDGMQAIRMTYYPPCPQPELVMGLPPHSDGTAITILLQVNGVEGLQIKKDGVWIPVNFLPDAFVVNVGDILEILSNGTYYSIEHRATVNSMKERMSIAMFFNSKLDAEIGPAKSLINPNNPPLFKSVGMRKYVKDFFSRKLDGKTYLEEMRIKYGEDNST